METTATDTETGTTTRHNKCGRDFFSLYVISTTFVLTHRNHFSRLTALGPHDDEWPPVTNTTHHTTRSLTNATVVVFLFLLSRLSLYKRGRA